MKKLPLPESQIQEVLYELINRKFTDRATMMRYFGVWNLPARISDLRLKGVNIISNKVVSFNKYGREVSFVKYSLKNRKESINIYDKMKKKPGCKLNN